MSAGKEDFRSPNRSGWSKFSLLAQGAAPFAAAFLALYFLPESLESPARWALAITAGTLVAWILRPVPLAATAIPVVFALGATGATSASGAVAGFGSSATLLLVAGFMMASAIDKTPLARRLTYLFLLRVPPNSGGVLGGLLVALAISAVFVPSTVVRAVAFLPVVIVVAEAFVQRGSENGAKRLLIGLAFGATLGGIAIFPAAIVNVLAVDLVVGAGGDRITYFGWFALTWPIEVLAFLTLWGGLVLLFPVRDEQPLDRSTVSADLQDLGPTQNAEWRLASILLLTAVLWMLEPLTGWHPSVPAFLAVSLLAISPLRVISWDEALDISWSSVFMFGASLSLALALRDTGAAEWVGEQFFGAGIGDFARLGAIAGVLAVAVMMLVFQLAFAGSTPAAATLLPILLASATALRLPPEVIGMTVALAGLATFVLPSQAMANLVTYQTGLYKARDLLKVGLLLTLVFLAILAGVALLWWRPVGFLG